MKKLFFTMLTVAFCATTYGQTLFTELYTLPDFDHTINFNNTSTEGYRVINEDDGSYSGLLNFQFKSSLTPNPTSIMTFKGQSIGIGTEVPAAKLHVNGTSYFSSQTKIGASSNAFNATGIVANFNDNFQYNGFNINTSGFGFYEAPTITPAGDPDYSAYVSGEKGINLFTNSESRMRITHDGLVGIGVDNPTSSLQIKGETNPSIKLQNGTNGRWIDLGLSNCDGCFSALSNNGDAVMRVAPGSKDFLLTNVGTGNTIFANGNFGSEAVSMVINNDGKVGIGTTTPGHELSVNGEMASINPLNTNASVHMSFNNNIARLRVGGTGNGSANGLDIQKQGDVSLLRILNNGNVGIGTITPNAKLSVNGKILAEEVEVVVDVLPDYVFEKYYEGKSSLKSDYIMPTLEAVAAYTKENHRLPEMPSAKEVKQDGLELGEMTVLLLQKIEELTLYTIEQEKRIQSLERKITDKD